MKKKNRALDIFSLSFLDVISCSFGAMILLILISKPLPEPTIQETLDAGSLLNQIFQTETSVENLQNQVTATHEEFESKELVARKLNELRQKFKAKLSQAQKKASQLDADLKGLSLVQSSLKRSSIRPQSAEVRDDEVGGIPVDSDYVIFIVDTSGSMKEIWDRVTAEVVNVINIHPQIKGFQILNDNGAHIVSAYEGRWIPDTPKRRQSVINLFRAWNSASNSSPVEGLEVALKRYAKPNISLSIYIFGDEYSGSSYDPVINALDNLNTSKLTGKRLAKIHAIGFISNYSTGRFATLMREVTRRNEGTFIALPR
jgi:hypothetical protein|tara:strand:- start:292 stop:1236 length:945 start_codon:yes stop_codon:yes gene_type:complete